LAKLVQSKYCMKQTILAYRSVARRTNHGIFTHRFGAGKAVNIPLQSAFCTSEKMCTIETIHDDDLSFSLRFSEHNCPLFITNILLFDDSSSSPPIFLVGHLCLPSKSSEVPILSENVYPKFCLDSRFVAARLYTTISPLLLLCPKQPASGPTDGATFFLLGSNHGYPPHAA